MPGTLQSRVRVAVALAAALALLATGCGGGGGGGVRLALVAYSTPREAYQALIPAFQQTPAGKGVSFSQSYGASGDQSRAVAAGLPADVVEFSLAPDMTRLVAAGLVAGDWDRNPTRGMVTDSVVALVVRKGNPKGIHGWDDLVRPGIQVITPNPFSSGGARWNVLAAYGAQLQQGRNAAQATGYLQRLFRNVPVQDKSARDALQTFVGGKGDVLLAYENEAIAAQQARQPVDYVLPQQTILIENPIAVAARSRHQTQARAFVDWLRGPQAQRIFAGKGYRPVDPAAARAAGFPTPAGLFTITDLGGWPAVTARFFDKQTGVMAGVERNVGVSVGS